MCSWNRAGHFAPRLAFGPPFVEFGGPAALGFGPVDAPSTPADIQQVPFGAQLAKRAMTNIGASPATPLGRPR